MLPRHRRRGMSRQTWFNVVIIVLLLGGFYRLGLEDPAQPCVGEVELEIALNTQVDEVFITNSTTSPNQINASNYFIHNPRDLCRSPSKAATRTVVIVVHTAREHYQARVVIRRTFGTIKTFRTWHFAIVFMLGRGTPVSNLMLNVEIKKHGDLVIADFVDTYRNLSHKHLAGLKWATEYCSSAEFYIKTDDDYLIEIFRAMALMASIPQDDSNYYCMKAVKWIPTRHRKNKYYLSIEEYAPNVFPTFCSGLYITRMETIRRVHAMAERREVRYLPMEDVFVTGLIRGHINRELMKNKPNQTNGNNTELESNIGRIGIMNKVADHIQFWKKNISFHFKNASFMEIYTAGSSKRACEVWDGVLRNHELLGMFKSC